MKQFVSRWLCRSYAFWDLACYACDSHDGWDISYCDWRNNSIVAIATCRQCHAKQFLKKSRQFGVERNDDARLGYETLRLIHSRYVNVPPFLLPQAYRFSFGSSAFSMEYIHGISMDEKIRQAGKKEDFNDCLRLSAAWLRELHHAPLSNDTVIGNNPETMLQVIEKNCDFLISRNKMVMQALILMRDGLSCLNEKTIKYVPLHGDFKASNLICAPQEKIYGIDFVLSFRNSGGMDIAQFFIDILLNRRAIKTMTSAGDLESILDVFLEAYGDNSQKNKRHVTWWLLYFLFSRWKADLNSFKPSLFAARSYDRVLSDILKVYGI